jgi:hypothetical protein
MAGKITGFFIEFTLVFSLILTIIGVILFIIGITSVLDMNILNLSADVLNWNIYFLIIGFFVLIAGIYYLFTYYKNRNFMLEELATNKRSELLKKHTELKQTAKRMPSKYMKLLKEKEEEFKIK